MRHERHCLQTNLPATAEVVGNLSRQFVAKRLLPSTGSLYARGDTLWTSLLATCLWGMLSAPTCRFFRQSPPPTAAPPGAHNLWMEGAGLCPAALTAAAMLRHTHRLPACSLRAVFKEEIYNTSQCCVVHLSKRCPRSSERRRYILEVELEQGFRSDLEYVHYTQDGVSGQQHVGTCSPISAREPTSPARSLTNRRTYAHYQNNRQPRRRTHRRHGVAVSVIRTSDVCSLAVAPTFDSAGFAVPCKSAIGAEWSRACLTNSDPIAYVTSVYTRLKSILSWNEPWNMDGMQGRRKRETKEKTDRLAASAGTISTRENPGTNPAGNRTHYTTASPLMLGGDVLEESPDWNRVGYSRTPVLGKVRILSYEGAQVWCAKKRTHLLCEVVALPPTAIGRRVTPSIGCIQLQTITIASSGSFTEYLLGRLCILVYCAGLEETRHADDCARRDVLQPRQARVPPPPPPATLSKHSTHKPAHRARHRRTNKPARNEMRARLNFKYNLLFGDRADYRVVVEEEGKGGGRSACSTVRCVNGDRRTYKCLGHPLSFANPPATPSFSFITSGRVRNGWERAVGLTYLLTMTEKMLGFNNVFLDVALSPGPWVLPRSADVAQYAPLLDILPTMKPPTPVWTTYAEVKSDCGNADITRYLLPYLVLVRASISPGVRASIPAAIGAAMEDSYYTTAVRVLAFDIPRWVRSVCFINSFQVVVTGAPYALKLQCEKWHDGCRTGRYNGKYGRPCTSSYEICPRAVTAGRRDGGPGRGSRACPPPSPKHGPNGTTLSSSGLTWRDPQPAVISVPSPDPGQVQADGFAYFL
ncbi:hypothetical protein PR048_014520 [Dryococelus australis]|uniref:Uncharacterized protein n=1 Tax=Dryococelus australis TaxID=614101 RepID=A0ABQ9HEG9_9NEOP|nr:hypothetical protein PR048_014520 [Dryococelus australis]